MKKEQELIRICTAGSVDDGKSTLIGRLLYETNQVFDDQLEAVKRASRDDEQIDLSLLTDGLAAEREQGITIDVAYRYFSTDSRRFIVADVPGHEQYTRNMVTGASSAQVGLILVDAQKGLTLQSKRHLFIVSLLRVPHVVILLNKMDLVNYQEEQFLAIKKDILSFCEKLDMQDLQFIPVSAFVGDNVVEPSAFMPWYTGRTVYDYLNTVEVASDKNLIDFRFPVQHVLRSDSRAYLGTVRSGLVRVGEEIMILPSMQTSIVRKLSIGPDTLQEAGAGIPVSMELEDERDISRGDMIVRPNNMPHVSNTFEAMVSWFDRVPLKEGKRYIIKHTTKETFATVETLHYELDIDTLHRKDTAVLSEHGIGKLHLVTQDPLFFDLYAKNRHTGSFVFIDPDSFRTVGAGVILQAKQPTTVLSASSSGAIVWFTGLSGSGKSTIADAVFRILEARGARVTRLDGDVMREALGNTLGFGEDDRRLNINIATFVARELAKQGVIVLASFISPYKNQREAVKASFDNTFEVFVNTPLDVCKARDVKGLYRKVEAGDITDFTGISSPYEVPEHPDLELDTVACSVEDCAQKIIDMLDA